MKLYFVVGALFAVLAAVVYFLRKPLEAEGEKVVGSFEDRMKAERAKIEKAYQDLKGK